MKKACGDVKYPKYLRCGQDVVNHFVGDSKVFVNRDYA